VSSNAFSSGIAYSWLIWAAMLAGLSWFTTPCHIREPIRFDLKMTPFSILRKIAPSAWMEALPAGKIVKELGSPLRIALSIELRFLEKNRNIGWLLGYFQKVRHAAFFSDPTSDEPGIAFVV
jgi:hypothetical protein